MAICDDKVAAVQANIKFADDLEKWSQDISGDRYKQLFKMIPGDKLNFTGDFPCPGTFVITQSDLDTFCSTTPDSVFCQVNNPAPPPTPTPEPAPEPTSDTPPPTESQVQGEETQEEEPSPEQDSQLTVTTSKTVKTIQERQEDFASFTPITVMIDGKEVLITSPGPGAYPGMNPPGEFGAAGSVGIALDNIADESLAHLKTALVTLIENNIISVDVIMNTLEGIPGANLVKGILKETTDCVKPPLISPPLDDIFKTVGLDICDGNGITAEITLPVIRKFKIGPFNDIPGMILQAAQDALEQLIFNLIQASFKMILDITLNATCETIGDVASLAGASNLKDALKNALCGPSANDAEVAQGLNDIMAAMDTYGGNLRRPSNDCVADFVDKIGSTLTNTEAKALMAGSPSPSTLAYIGEILQTQEEQCMSQFLKGDQDIVQLFGGLGNVLDPNIIDAFLEAPPTNLPFNPNICQNPNNLQQFDNVRAAMLANRGLSPDQVDYQLAKNKERQRQTLDDLNNLLASLDNLKLPDLVSTDPLCPEKGILPNTDEETSQAISSAFGDMYSLVNIAFLEELVNRQGLLNMILSDVRGTGLKWHSEFFIRFFGQPLASQLGLFGLFADADDGRKTKFLAVEDKVLGIFPETIGLYLKQQLETLSPNFQSSDQQLIPNSTIKAPDLVLNYADWDSLTLPFGTGEISYKFNINFDNFSINQSGNPIPDNTFKVTLSNLFDPEGMSYQGLRTLPTGAQDFIDDLSVDLETIPQADTFAQMIHNTWEPYLESEDIQEITDYCKTDLYNYINSAILKKFSHKISENARSFAFGYDPELSPEIVLLTDYETYGGSEEMPPFYIETPKYGGWLGIYEGLVPEVDACDRKPIIDFNKISEHVNSFNDKIQQDPRLEFNPLCVIEPPYARILEKEAAAAIEGSIVALVRLYIVESFIKGMPVFSLFDSKYPEVFDEVLFGYLGETMLKDILELGGNVFLNPEIKKKTFYYTFLEQVVQNFGRKIEAGDITPTQEEQGALDRINFIVQTWVEPTGNFKKVKKRRSFEAYMEATQDDAKLILRRYIRDELKTVSDLFKDVLSPSIHELSSLVFGSPNWMVGALTDNGPMNVPTNSADDIFAPEKESGFIDAPDLEMQKSSEWYMKGSGYFPFVLEKYITIQKYETDERPEDLPPLGEDFPINVVITDSSVTNLISFQDWVTDNKENFAQYTLADAWENVSFGLRISCILPSDFKNKIGAEKYEKIIENISSYPALGLKSLKLEGADENTTILFPLVDTHLDLDMNQVIAPSLIDQYDITCLVNEMIKDPQYETLFNYCFPLQSLLSLVTIYTIEGFLPSLGWEWGFPAEANTNIDYTNYGGVSGGQNLSQFRRWDKENFTKTKKMLRGIFRSNYHVRDLNYTDPEQNSAEEEARINLKIKAKMPKIKNKKGKEISMPWWMKKMLRPKPKEACEVEES